MQLVNTHLVALIDLHHHFDLIVEVLDPTVLVLIQLPHQTQLLLKLPHLQALLQSLRSRKEMSLLRMRRNAFLRKTALYGLITLWRLLCLKTLFSWAPTL
mmetsp:Transcript_24113/g.23719  ORF Transcript_24113/g.23719 Transcript_24113/m.23719 type:complete len:100 (-) Transcript_24113:128-427(-)